MKRLSYWTLECLLRPLVEPFNVWSTSSALMSCDLWPRSQGLILVSPMSPVNWLPILENICKFLPMKLFRWMGTATMRIIKWSWSLFWLSRDVSEQKKQQQVPWRCSYLWPDLLMIVLKFHTTSVSRWRSLVLMEGRLTVLYLRSQLHCFLRTSTSTKFPTSEGICLQVASISR